MTPKRRTSISRLSVPGLAACIAAMFMFPPQSFAQPTATPEARIRIVSSNGIPLPGALIALIDANGRAVAEGISSEDGMRTLRAPAGTYRVRVLRIGYRPYVSDPASIPRTGDIVLRIETQAVALKSVVVVAGSPCERIDNDLQTVSVVWEEIEKALRTSRLFIDDLAGVGHARTYRRIIRNDGVVISADSAVAPISDGKPFGAINPATLAARGYVQGDAANGWEYYGPDETVLLSSEFATTHCFQLRREKGRTGRIGLAFKPIPGRKVSDIAGVLWVDEATSELREITFQYVNAGVLDKFNAGGFTRFRRLASGAWLVDEWQLRMPRLEMKPGYPESLIALAYLVNGGGIVSSRKDPSKDPSVPR